MIFVKKNFFCLFREWKDFGSYWWKEKVRNEKILNICKLFLVYYDIKEIFGKKLKWYDYDDMWEKIIWINKIRK